MKRLSRALFGFLATLVACLAIAPGGGASPSVAWADQTFCACGVLHSNMIGHMSAQSYSYDYTTHAISSTGPVVGLKGIANNAGVYMLGEDVTVGGYDPYWAAPTGETVLFTDGYDISFDLSNKQGTAQGSIVVQNNSTLTISGYTSDTGRTTTITGNSGLATIYVGSGATLNLYGVEITSTGSNMSGVYVADGGTLNVYPGTYNGYPTASLVPTKITNNVTYGITSYGGTVNIYGGEISGNASGGVFARDNQNNAVVNMYGGTISNNTGSGVFLGTNDDDLSSTLNMYAGTITGNGTSNGTGGGVNIDGASAKMTLHGENVSTSIATTSGSTRLGSINISGNNGATGPNVYVNNKNSSDSRISVTAGSPTTLRTGSTIGITLARCATGTDDEGWVTSNVPGSATYFTSDVSGYGISTSTGGYEKVVQVKTKDAPVKVKDINVGYTGSAVDASLADNNSGIDGTWSWKDTANAPTNVGTYYNVTVVFTPTDTARYKAVEKTVMVTITKADPTFTVTPASLTYNGTDQNLLSAATVDGGTLSFRTATETSYSTSIPTGKNAGTYPVYYQIKGDANHKDVGISSVTATINPKEITVSITPGGGTYGDTITPASATLSGVVDGDTVPVTLTYSGTTDDGTSYNSTNVPTKAGTYTVTASVSDGNYKLTGTTTATMTIGKKTITVTDVKVKDKAYDGTTNAEIDGTPTLSGVVGSDNVSLVNGTPTFAQKDVGTDIDVSFTEFSLAGDNAGNYTLTQPSATKASITPRPITVTITPNGGTYGGTITPASATLSGVVDGDTVPVTLFYSGTANDGTKYDESTAMPGYAGTYTVRASISDTNYTLTGTNTAEFVVARAAGSVNITNDPSKTYDGQAVSTPTYTTNNTAGTVTIEYKVKDADDSTYSTTAPKDAGSYTVRVSVAQSDSYEAAYATKDFTIRKKDVTITGTAIVQSKVYDGTTTVQITSTGTPSDNYDGANLTITQGTAAYDSKTVGTGKPVTFSGFALAGTAAGNYNLASQPASTTADITARTLTVNVAVKDKIHDGTAAAAFDGDPTLVGVLVGDDVTLVPGTPTFSQTTVGTGIPISFTEFKLTGTDAGNYSLTQPSDVTASIIAYNAAAGTDYTVNSNGWINTDFVVTAVDGNTLSLSDVLGGTWASSLSASDETANGQLLFWVLRSDGALSEQVIENYKIDKTASTGTVGLSGTETTWQSLVDPVSFSLFFNSAQTLSATAQDALSGVDSVAYYVANGQLTEAELADLDADAWTALPSEGAVIPAEDGRAFVAYVRVADVAGNVTYLSTDGVVYDLTAPVIGGVEDGATYYATRSVIVTDANLASVTVNGEDVQDISAPITLAGNTEATYEIVATDKAGNVTRVLVSMRPIAAAVPGDVSGITEDTVTPEDREEIEEAISQLEAIDLTNATDEERQAVEAQLSAYRALLDKIDEIEEAERAAAAAAGRKTTGRTGAATRRGVPNTGDVTGHAWAAFAAAGGLALAGAVALRAARPRRKQR